MTYKRKEVIGECTFDVFPISATIYGIMGDEMVYIGSTTQNVKNRIRAHISDAKEGSDLPIHKWIRNRGYKFHVCFLETCAENVRDKIEKYWVAKFENLLNVTDGGKGMSGHRFAGTGHAKKIGDGLKTGETFHCLKCGSPFWRKRGEILKSHNKYCSRLCSNGRNRK